MTFFLIHFTTPPSVGSAGGNNSDTRIKKEILDIEDDSALQDTKSLLLFLVFFWCSSTEQKWTSILYEKIEHPPASPSLWLQSYHETNISTCI
jgi:hypothetical protein